ncbi:MAG TPA: EAL domain-containing protein [Acidimicrobiales bacterium]|nr:EAL domain-containing protein [Acidimicrobiales bacterium]
MSNTFLVALLQYLERAGGPGLVGQVMAAAGSTRPIEEIRAARWGTRDEVLGLAAAAADLTGDHDIGRRVGEEMFRMSVSDPATRAFFISQGSPGAALDGVLDYTVKMGRGRTYRVLSRDAGGCVVEGEYESSTLGHPFFCGLALGYWPMLATLFGAVGTGIHPRCQARGDDTCTFVIRWDPDAALATNEVEAADAELRRRIRTFEEMQSVAEDLARAADLPSLAECILDAVDDIIAAPQLLVAITAQAGRPPVVASRGLGRGAAEATALALLEGRPGPGAVIASAPLGAFGLVAALAPGATTVSKTSSRLLDAFARHAGARIEAVLSRQQAEESRQTASALLLLARSLSETTTETDVWECLVRAVPSLVGSDHAAVLRWNADDLSLRTVAYVGPPDQPPQQEFSASQVPALYEMAARPTPFVLHRSTAIGFIADAMALWDEDVDVVVPLVEKGDFLGFICAGYQDGRKLDRDAAFARIEGAAGLAATAFTNARLLEEIRHQALHDDLTGLPNRVLLEDRVRQGLKEAKRHGRKVALLFLDLDRFKNVNDSMGHEFGDILIQAAAGRIRGCLRESDVFARMGGDEFVIVLQEVSGADDARLVATKILEDLRRPFEIGGRDLYISASIGVAVYPEDGGDYGALLQAADGSMYAAKSAGRNTVTRKQPAPGQSDGEKRLSLETELHRALESDGITVVYQPQVAMADLKLVGVEALVRWEHPSLGALPPSEFLPIAEECGLMPRLDRLVRRMAFRQARAWQETIGSVMVAVNVSAQTLCRPSLLDEMAADLRECGVDPTTIEVELTEGMVGDDELIPVVDGLADMGLRVAIDDFGTGASVFARLQRLPLHTLKIDRSLIGGREASRDWSIVAAIIDMSHSLGLTVVAEGVESAVQAGHLRKCGCDSGQGYLFGRPLPVDEVEKVMYTHLNYLDRPAFGGRSGGVPKAGRTRTAL